jgi:hypothetical protein
LFMIIGGATCDPECSLRAAVALLLHLYKWQSTRRRFSHLAFLQLSWSKSGSALQCLCLASRLSFLTYGWLVMMIMISALGVRLPAVVAGHHCLTGWRWWQDPTRCLWQIGRVSTIYDGGWTLFHSASLIACIGFMQASSFPSPSSSHCHSDVISGGS